MSNYTWDDVIENDGKERKEILPEGDYRFKVDKLEKTTVGSDGKYKGAPMAKMSFTLSGEEGTSEMTCCIILNDAFDWKISGFFRAIGAKKKGEKMVMNWREVEGKEGMAHVIVQDGEYKGKATKKNDIGYFIDYDPANFTAVNDDDACPWD